MIEYHYTAPHHQLITYPAHFSDNSLTASSIDHFMTADKELYWMVGVIPHGATDHFSVFSTRKKAYSKHDKDIYTGHSYRKIDKNVFQYDVLTSDQDEAYKCEDPENAWNIFKSGFFHVLDKHAPYKMFNSRRDCQSWVTTEYLERANERDEK